ncbi:MAG: phosphotransferase [Microlunatus sp.]|nr:phosphotransferase [Microlunatus sp.]
MLDEVLTAFGLPGKIISIHQIGRAWSNRVFQVRTSAAEYAIKQLLNPWQEPDWLAWMREAADFELHAAEAGIAMPRPIRSPDGLIFVEVGGATFRAHAWIAGDPCPDGPVAEDTALLVGAELARIHALHHLPGRTDVFPTPSRAAVDGWDDLVGRIAEHDQELARQAVAAGPAVGRIGELFDRSETDFSGQPMSHGDVDQKNLIMTATGPVLCDWDVAAPWPARQELARTALSLAGWRFPGVARAVLTGYRGAGGEAYRIVPEDFGVDACSGLDWTVLCLERAAGLRNDGEQRRQEAAESVPDLLAGMQRQLDLIENIGDWLRR